MLRKHDRSSLQKPWVGPGGQSAPTFRQATSDAEARHAWTGTGGADDWCPCSAASPSGTSGRLCTEKAEQLGFPEVWVVEDCFLHGAFAQAATILASTTSLHVGLGIVPQPRPVMWRSPPWMSLPWRGSTRPG